MPKNQTIPEMSRKNLKKSESKPRPVVDLPQKKWDRITSAAEKAFHASYDKRASHLGYQIKSYRLEEDDYYYIITYSLMTAGPNFVVIYLSKDNLEFVHYVDGYLCG